MPLYRQYNPYATTGTHNYTLSKDENDNLVKAGWNAEGIGWYGYNPVAFAVYSADDSSLDFCKRAEAPSEGSKFNGKNATEVYTGIENMSGFHYSDDWSDWTNLGLPGWHALMMDAKIETSTIQDAGIQPVNTEYWFGQWIAATGIALKEINNIDKLDTSKTTSMSNMFNYSFSLTSLDLSNFNTSNVQKMKGMFCSCSKLKNLKVSNWDTSNVTTMSSMFSGCMSLSSFDVSNFNTSKVTDMSDMFSYSFSLTSLDLSNSNTSNVQKMKGMFCSCSKLKNLKVSNWDTSNVTDMRAMFAFCYKLSSIDVSKWNTSTVKDMSRMFSGCSSLSSLDLSKWDTSNVAEMDYMFENCSSLNSLDVSKWNTSKVTSMGSYSDGMFEGCSSLKSLDLSKWDTSNVVFMNYVFSGCTNLKVDCSKWNVAKVKEHKEFATNAPGVISPSWVS